eukprot:CAMPEP_0202721002 /NCGR_PEP_ID=MMETSP1385-20130828/145355_1 /ASSEMBLY_ACC=CAM_ASM_000861 /TAXON_ID=933848 /ORGANISM="Elphidium margaritaceum" /LENGTH=31 /DNA_ID= /DNA_START= /DNA_END= /DNA_ORIENTATION=
MTVHASVDQATKCIVDTSLLYIIGQLLLDFV